MFEMSTFEYGCEAAMTDTVIIAINGQVVIRHNILVGTQYLSVQQARDFAEALLEKSVMAEAQQKAAMN